MFRNSDPQEKETPLHVQLYAQELICQVHMITLLSPPLQIHFDGLSPFCGQLHLLLLYIKAEEQAISVFFWSAGSPKPPREGVAVRNYF